MIYKGAMEKKFYLLVAGAAGFLLCAASAVAQTTYTLTDLGSLPGQTTTTPSGINNQGEGSGTSGPTIHALRFANGAVQDLGTLPGGIVSTGQAINDLGQVVGDSEYSPQGGAIRHATLFSNGTAIDLGTLPSWGNYSRGNGINNLSEVVGHTGTSLDTSNTRPFIWDASNGIRDLGSLGGGFGKAYSINDAGQATGTSKATLTFHAFIWDSANGMRDIGTIGGDTSTGRFINANGHVVGYSTINNFDNRQHAFLYDGTMHDLGSLGPNSPYSDFSYAFGINIDDVVVGGTYLPYKGGGLEPTAFVYRDGKMFDLNELLDSSGADYRVYSARGINDAGQIIVTAVKLSTNDARAVLLTPVTTGSDTVTITRAVYNSRRQQLTVQATDSDPSATLQVYVTSTDTLIGTLTKKRTGYSGKFTLATNPQNITVKSSLGGSDTAAVTGR